MVKFHYTERVVWATHPYREYVVVAKIHRVVYHREVEATFYCFAPGLKLAFDYNVRVLKFHYTSETALEIEISKVMERMKDYGFESGLV